MAAQVLHLPKGYASHNGAMSAYHRLRLPLYTPPFFTPEQVAVSSEVQPDAEVKARPRPPRRRKGRQPVVNPLSLKLESNRIPSRCFSLIITSLCAFALSAQAVK